MLCNEKNQIYLRNIHISSFTVSGHNLTDIVSSDIVRKVSDQKGSGRAWSVAISVSTVPSSVTTIASTTTVAFASAITSFSFTSSVTVSHFALCL